MRTLEKSDRSVPWRSKVESKGFGWSKPARREGEMSIGKSSSCADDGPASCRHFRVGREVSDTNWKPRMRADLKMVRSLERWSGQKLEDSRPAK